MPPRSTTAAWPQARFTVGQAGSGMSGRALKVPGRLGRVMFAASEREFLAADAVRCDASVVDPAGAAPRHSSSRASCTWPSAALTLCLGWAESFTPVAFSAWAARPYTRIAAWLPLGSRACSHCKIILRRVLSEARAPAAGGHSPGVSQTVAGPHPRLSATASCALRWRRRGVAGDVCAAALPQQGPKLGHAAPALLGRRRARLGLPGMRHSRPPFTKPQHSTGTD